jgi:hypothetical protein
MQVKGRQVQESSSRHEKVTGGIGNQEDAADCPLNTIDINVQQNSRINKCNLQVARQRDSGTA